MLWGKAAIILHRFAHNLAPKRLNPGIMAPKRIGINRSEYPKGPPPPRKAQAATNGGRPGRPAFYGNYRHRVAGLQEREIHAHVGWAACVWLDVGVLTVKELLGTLDRQCFYLIGKFLTAVVALARVALTVFVVVDRSHRLEDCGRNVVLGGNELHTIALPAPKAGFCLLPRMRAVDGYGRYFMKVS